MRKIKEVLNKRFEKFERYNKNYQELFEQLEALCPHSFRF